MMLKFQKLLDKFLTKLSNIKLNQSIRRSYLKAILLMHLKEKEKEIKR